MMTEPLVDMTRNILCTVIERVNAGKKLAEIGDPRPGIGVGEDGIPKFVWTEWVPVGSFIMGSTASDIEALDNERPEHLVSFNRFRISKYPVTNIQFKAFVDADDGWKSDLLWTKNGLLWRDTVDIWQQGRVPDNFPCVNVSWHAAVAFSNWASARCVIESGCKLRLPTEPEWERACRGTNKRRYPWGSDFDTNNCNMKDTGIGDLCSVGLFPGGKSPVGALDMLGGAWEWCLSLSGPYPYETEREIAESAGKRVIRGGAYNQDKTGVRCAIRREDPPEHIGGRISFRLVCVSVL